ncbi:MAG: hypothetical protein KatS3mg008_0049 [Acidimicrobiales bacterium]|nr:MAG: hypothetical protein KatS3mg008_0049 [Acidimicrobiales bacterium]
MRRRVLLLLLPALVASACGIPADEKPRAIAAEDLPPGLASRPTTTTTPPVDSVVRTIYFVRETTEGDPRLAPTPKRVRLPADIPQVLDTLFSGPDTREVSSRIPDELRLLDFSLDAASGTLTLNLSSELGTVTGTGQTLAFAQIVWTVTEFPDVRAVRFEIEGRPTDAPTPQESLPIVRRSDYQQYAAEVTGTPR